MAYLKKRGKIWYIVFDWYEGQKQKKRLFTLRTTRKKIADDYLEFYDELETREEIHPEDPNFKIDLDVLKKDATPYTVTLDMAIEAFLKDQTHLSEGGYTAYKTILENWARTVVKKENYAKRLGTYPVAPNLYYKTCIGEDEIKLYVMRDGIRNATRHKELRHIKRFFNWLIKQNRKGKFETGVIENPTEDLLLPRDNTDTSVKMPHPDEITSLFEAFDRYHAGKKANNKEWQQQRWFKPLMLTYYFTGCRRGEPLRSRRMHIIDAFTFLRIVDTKGNKLRDVYIKEELRPHLEAWYQEFPDASLSAPLFPNPQTGLPLTGNHVYREFKKYAKKAGLPAERTIHGLRHHSVTQDLRDGLSLSFVRDQHGHSTTRITEKYEHLARIDLKRAYERVNGKKRLPNFGVNGRSREG